MSQPTPGSPSVSDLGASLVRTFVATAVGTLLAYLAKRMGLVLSDGDSLGLIQGVTALFIGGYYLVVRLLESKWKGFGFLLGLVRQPKYVTPTSSTL
jgi:hypothetical protein